MAGKCKKRARTESAAVQAFPPIAEPNARILILGSMPGVASLQAQQYYAHPRNAFWPLLGRIFNQETDTWKQRKTLLKAQQLALWDVLKQCQRNGSLDADIQPDSIICNDFKSFLRQLPGLQRIVFNGKAAERLFTRHVLPTLDDQTEIQRLSMPSTSPAMASLNLAEKTEIWRSAVLP